MRTAVAALATAAVALAGCDRGCASLWTDWQTLDPRTAGSSPGSGSATAPGGGRASPLGIDCPDGLARCEDGRVWVSRLTTLPATCGRASAPCVCPWDSIASCLGACAAEGAVAVIERDRAAVQMCAPERRTDPEARPEAPFVRPLPLDSQVPSNCDEDDAYRCSDSVVVDCALADKGGARGVGRCSNGCSSSGVVLFGEGIDRESAFAILCSR